MKITPGHGPASTPDVTTVPEARLRVLRALAESEASRADNAGAGAHGAPLGLTVHELAAVLGAHPNGVRRHLDGLVAAGLVAAHTNPARGRGRPSTAYQVTAAGRTAAAGGAAPISRDYLAMATAFAQHIADTAESPSQDAHRVGHTWGRMLAQQNPADLAPRQRPLPPGGGATEAGQSPEGAGAAVQSRLVGLLGSLGFSPVRRPDGAVSLRTCPLLEAARANPEVLCEVHLGLVRGASEALGGPGEGGELAAFAEPGACVLRLPGAGAGERGADGPGAERLDAGHFVDGVPHAVGPDRADRADRDQSDPKRSRV